MQAELRRQRDTLSISGAVVIAFSLWSVIKVFAFAFITPDGPIAALPGMQQLDKTTALALASIAGFASMAIPVGLRVYVGSSARAEARGKRRSSAYLVLAGVLLASEVIELISAPLIIPDVSLLYSIVHVCISLSSIYALFDLIRSGTAARRIAQQLAASGR